MLSLFVVCNESTGFEARGTLLAPASSQLCGCAHIGFDWQLPGYIRNNCHQALIEIAVTCYITHLNLVENCTFMTLIDKKKCFHKAYYSKSTQLQLVKKVVLVAY